MRLVTALAVETSEEWLTGRRYLDIEELKQERSGERGSGGGFHGVMSKLPFWGKLQKIRDLTAPQDLHWVTLIIILSYPSIVLT